MLDEVVALFDGNVESAEAWMVTPAPALMDRTPAECIDEGDEDDVISLVNKLEYGIVV